MILLYPVGIPTLFIYLLLTHRDKINPSVADEAGTPTLGVRARSLPSNRAHSRVRSGFFLDKSVEARLTTSHSIYEDEIAPVGRVGTVLGGKETSKRLSSSGGNGSCHGDNVCSVDGAQNVLDFTNTPTTNAHREEVKTQSFETDGEGLGKRARGEGEF